MSNIVDFPHTHSSPSRPATDNLPKLAERVADIRTRLKANRPMVTADQIMAAEGIWRLLERLHDQGVTKTEVLQTAGIARDEDSTKHLGQYALNPNRKGKGTGRLNKKPSKYIAILDAAAKLAGTDPDKAFLEVFGTTSLMTTAPDRTAAPEYEELALRLCEIALAVATKHDLQKYFQDILRTGLKLHVRNEDTEVDQDGSNLGEIELAFGAFQTAPESWPVQFYEFTCDCDENDLDDYVPSYPSLILDEWDWPGSDKYYDFYWDFPSKKTEDGDDPAFEIKAENTVSGSYSVELRVCIVPVGPDLRPEPALRVKTRLLCYSNEQ